MAFVLISAQDVHFGPTTISTEDSRIHEEIGNELTIASKPTSSSGKTDKSDKSEKSKDKKSDVKHDKLSKLDKYLHRKQGLVNVVEGKSIKFDPASKSYMIKVDDSVVRVLNKFARMGFQVVPSSSGSGGTMDFRGGGGQVWTMYRHAPPPYNPNYPNLGPLNIRWVEFILQKRFSIFGFSIWKKLKLLVIAGLKFKTQLSKLLLSKLNQLII